MQWKKLSKAEQETEKEEAMEKARKHLLDSNLCSDIPFQGCIHQDFTGKGE